MAKHIHIWLRGSTQDADGPAHVPAGSSKGGQFTSGSGGGGGSAAPKPSHNKGASALHAFQAKFNQQLKESGHGHLVKGVAEKRRAEAERLSKSASKKTTSPAPSSKAGPVNPSSGPDEDKLRARVKAARAGMQAAGKNKAEYERHEQQFESSMEALTTLQEKNKAAGKN